MSDEFTPRRAVKSRVKLKLALDGPSGTGKTKGALALATFIAQQMAVARGKPDSWKILGIDTENESMALYADEYVFDHIPFRAPFTSDRYKLAMQNGIIGGYDVVVVDSLSHQWEGSGSVRARKDALDMSGAKGASNQFSNWGKFSAEHTEFIEYLKSLDVHTICTMRSKMEYVLEEVDGKKVPRKVGLAPIQREGVDYEFSLVFDIGADHLANASKDRTSIFAGKGPVDLLEPGTARKIWDWLNSGVAVEVLKLTSEDRLHLASILKSAGISREDFAAYLMDLGSYVSSADVPRSRLFELESWINTPREVSNEEKIARQTMEALKMDAGARQTLIAKNRSDWSAINEELDLIADDRANAQRQPPQGGPQQAKAAPGGEFVLDGPELFCCVVGAERREATSNREYFLLKVNGNLGPDAKDQITCWHKSLFPALSEAKGKQCQLVVKFDNGHAVLEDVRMVGDRRYEKGKLLKVEGDRFVSTENMDAEPA